MAELWEDYCFTWRHYPLDMAFTSVVFLGLGLFVGFTLGLLLFK